MGFIVIEGLDGAGNRITSYNVCYTKLLRRSPKDKFIVENEASKDTIWWTSPASKNDNKKVSEEAWSYLKQITTKQLSGKRLFVVDAFLGANEDSRLKVRFIMEVAWQAHFVKNMFIRPSELV